MDEVKSNAQNTATTISGNEVSISATPDELMEAMKKLAKLPRNANPTRLHNRCSVTGRARGYSRMFGLCRQQVRTQASEGKLPGVRKSSW